MLDPATGMAVEDGADKPYLSPGNYFETAGIVPSLWVPFSYNRMLWPQTPAQQALANGFFQAAFPNPIVNTRIQLADGSATSPSLTWTEVGEQNSGLYRVAANDYGYGVGGSLVTEWLSAEFRVNYLTPGSVVFAGANGKLNQNNASFFWDNTNLLINVIGGTRTLPAYLAGASNGNTDLWVQFGAMPSWTGANMPGGGNWHTFADCTISTAGGIGSGSFDDIVIFQGGVANFTDHAAFEGRPTIQGASTIGTFYGLFWKPQVVAGSTCTTMYGAYIWDYSGTGTVTTQYGLYIAPLLKAGTVWGVYVDGTSQSSFGGNVLPGTDNAVNFGSSTFRWLNGFFTGTVSHTCAAATTDAVTATVTGDANLRFVLNADGSMEWGSGSAAADFTLRRIGVGISQVSGGTQAQIIRVYGTTDSNTAPANYERFQIRTQAGTTVLEQTQAGTGTVRALNFQTVGSANLILGTNNTDRWKIIGATGHFVAQLDNTYDIGATGATRPGNLFLAGDFNSESGNGQQFKVSKVTELTTIAAAATTDTAIQIPVNAVVFAVSVRVVTVIPTATTFTVTGATSGTEFDVASGVSTAANTTDVGTALCPYKNGAAQKIRFTPNLNPATATGQVRVTIHYYQITPATS